MLEAGAIDTSLEEPTEKPKEELKSIPKEEPKSKPKEEPKVIQPTILQDDDCQTLKTIIKYYQSEIKEKDHDLEVKKYYTLIIKKILSCESDLIQLDITQLFDLLN